MVCNFLVRKLHTIFLNLKKKLSLKTWKKSPQKLLIFGPNLFFSFANWPKTSPNLIFCSIKMSPSYIMTLISFFSLVFHLHMICTCWHLTTSNFVHFYFVLTKIPSDIYPPSTVTVTMRKEKRETCRDEFEPEFSGSSEPELWRFRAEPSRAGALQFSSWRSRAGPSWKSFSSSCGSSQLSLDTSLENTRSLFSLSSWLQLQGVLY